MNKPTYAVVEKTTNSWTGEKSSKIFYKSDEYTCDCEKNYRKDCKNPEAYKTTGCN